MASVTQRISKIKQPPLGYVPVQNMDVVHLNDIQSLEPMTAENISPSLVGLSVDYLTRYMTGAAKEEAFKISLLGARCADQYLQQSCFLTVNINQAKSQKLLNSINGIDDSSILAACKLVAYDSAYRAGIIPTLETVNPNPETISNIRIMVNRGVQFFNQYGPVAKDGFTFAGAYTDTITSGDGDFLTYDILWDFKVSKHPPTINHTLQIFVYYLMGLRSLEKEYFQSITKLGIFNPRRNEVYTLDLAEIPPQTFKEVSEKVIGYSQSQK